MFLLLAPGPLRYPFIKEGINYFLKLIRNWINVDCYFPKIRGTFSSKEERLREEGKSMLKYIQKEDFLIVLDERGVALNTENLAEFLKKTLDEKRKIVFLVGGPEGISKDVFKRADFQLKLSDFTLNHEIALLVLTEAIFRAISLLKGHPYHRK